jgi:hypothetical protein
MSCGLAAARTCYVFCFLAPSVPTFIVPPSKDDELVKSHRMRWLSKKPQMQGAQNLRNEAYIWYAAVTKVAAQVSELARLRRRSWGVFVGIAKKAIPTPASSVPY